MSANYKVGQHPILSDDTIRQIEVLAAQNEVHIRRIKEAGLQQAMDWWERNELVLANGEVWPPNPKSISDYLASDFVFASKDAQFTDEGNIAAVRPLRNHPGMEFVFQGDGMVLVVDLRTHKRQTMTVREACDWLYRRRKEQRFYE